MSVQQQKYTDVVLADVSPKNTAGLFVRSIFHVFMFSAISNAGTFPRSSYTCFPPGGSLHWCRTQTNRLSCRTTGAKTKFFAFIVVTLAGVYATKILLTGCEAERLHRVYPFKFSKARARWWKSTTYVQDTNI